MKNYITLLLIAISISGCQGFLEENPKDELGFSDFFTERDHAYNAVNVLYRSGTPNLIAGQGSYSGTRVMLGGYLSGLFNNEYKGQEIHVQYSQNLTLNGDNLGDYMGGIWDELYKEISRANTAITYIPTTPDLTESEKNTLLAEARFFRAFSYLQLVRTFGDVPLITSAYESLDDLYVARTASADVYNLVVEDLTFALTDDYLSDKNQSANGFRVTKGMAQMLLADAYLSLSGYPTNSDHYAEAATQIRNLVASGSYALLEHGVGTNNGIDPENSAYNKLRTLDATKETIYALEYEKGISNATHPVWSYPNNFGAKGYFAYSITVNAYRPIDEYLLMYDTDEDLRIQNKQFFHNSYDVEQEDGSFVTEEFDLSPYLWHDDEALLSSATSGKDINYYRYAEALLIGAEAIAKSEGVTSEAVDYLTQVRARALWKKEKEDIKQTLSALSVDDFVKEVWVERSKELILDWKTWTDVQRTRQYPDVSGEGNITFSNVVGHSNNWGKTFTENHLLFPIPEPEIQRNPELTQNPGY